MTLHHPALYRFCASHIYFANGGFPGHIPWNGVAVRQLQKPEEKRFAVLNRQPEFTSMFSISTTILRKFK